MRYFSRIGAAENAEFSTSKFQQMPVLPIELCEYSPGEYMNMDLFKIKKKDFLPCTDKLSRLILGREAKELVS